MDSAVFWKMMRRSFLNKIQSFGEILTISISDYPEDEASRISHSVWSVYQRTILNNSEEKHLHIHSVVTSNLTGFMTETVMWGVLRGTAGVLLYHRTDKHYILGSLILSQSHIEYRIPLDIKVWKNQSPRHDKNVKVKQSRYRPGGVQRFLGS